MNHRIQNIILAVIAVVCIFAGQTSYAYTTHYVAKGETLWGISRKYHVSVDDLLRLNPELKNGLKSETTIKIPESSELADSSTPSAQTVSATDTAAISTGSASDRLPIKNYYTAVFGDSFSSISRKTGVPVDTLRHYNPFIDESTIAEGTIVRISNQPLIIESTEYLTMVDSIVYKIKPDGLVDNSINDNQYTIVLVLPFDSESMNLTVQSLHATDFYKGFLLSAYRNRMAEGMPHVKIVAMDIQERPELTVRMLQNMNLGSNSIIIPADDEALIGAIAKYGAELNIPVLNVLSVKDNNYQSYPNVLQANITQNLMYSKAIAYMMSEFDGYIPVVLDLEGGAREKSGYIDAMKREYASKGINVVELTYNKALSDKDLQKLDPKKKYVFIPKSGSPEVFASFSPALSSYLDKNYERARLFGYPDWVVFIGEQAQKLHDMKAVIYSRFYMDADDAFTKNVLDDFNRWYGAPMTVAFPMQGMLGYDTGNFIFRSLRRNFTNDPIGRYEQGSYNGDQSSFNFGHDNGSLGLVNKALYIIEYLPGETIYVKVI